MIGKGPYLRSKDSKTVLEIQKQNPLRRTTPIQTLSLFSFPFRAVTGSRPTFIYGTVGERGLAHGAWSAVAATSGVQEWLRPRGVSAPHGTVPVSRWSDSGTPPWRRSGSGHPCGGTETGPNRADARRKSSNRMHWLEGPPRMAVAGLKLRGRGCHRSSVCFDDGRRQFTNVSRLLQQPQLS
jgi:hypothetical protein